MAKTKATKEVQSTKAQKIDSANKERMYKHIDKGASYKEQKKFRGKQRRLLQKQSNNLFVANLKKDKSDIKKATKEFVSFYKEHYVLNDFSIESLYKGSNEAKLQEVKEILSIVKVQIAK